MKKKFKVLLDIIEIWIPVVMLLTLFVVFVLGVFYRYVVKDPKSWTYELSTVCFLSFVILSACYVQRQDKHIVFDMIFNKMSDKTQCIMRITSNCITALTCIILTPTTVHFLSSMQGLTTQILKIPRGLVFVCFLILFVSTAIRGCIRAAYDIKAFTNKTYTCQYLQQGEVDS